MPPPLPSVALRAPREGPALPRHGEPVSDPESEADPDRPAFGVPSDSDPDPDPGRPAFGGCLPILILNLTAETCGW